jgi:hypothetical protein
LALPRSLISITSGGSGGTNGTYTIPTTGGTGTALVQASLTATVSGGVLTSLVVAPGGGGGGFATAPTPNFAACGFSVAPVVVLGLDPVASTQYNMALLMAAASVNRVIISPWVSTGVGTINFARSRRIAAWEKATYGAQAWDALPFWSKWHCGSESDLVTVRQGVISPSLTLDGLHPDDRGVSIEGRELARIVRASAGIGAPYIHDDMVGIKNGATLGSAVLTPRVIGTAKGFQIVDGNNVDAVRINSTTGAITRGAGTVPAVTELFVQSDSLRKGRSNIARIIGVRQSDVTVPGEIVRVIGNGAGAMTTDKLTGGVGGKQMTFAICCRVNDLSSATIISTTTTAGNLAQIQRSGKTLRALIYNSAGTLIANGFWTVPVDPFAFNWFFLCMDTTTGTQTMSLVTNELAAVTATPTADALYPFDVAHNLFYSSGTFANNLDVKMIWMAQGYLDITNSANRALFYTAATGAPVDLGASGVVSGLTPIIYMHGRSGDYLLGNNFGSGGPFYVPPYVNADNVGFVDLAA